MFAKLTVTPEGNPKGVTALPTGVFVVVPILVGHGFIALLPRVSIAITEML